MGTTVEDVETRHRKGAGGRAAEVTEKGQTHSGRCSTCRGERYREKRVRAEVLFVGGAVEIEHDLVDLFLASCVASAHGVGNGGVDVVDGPRNALPAEAVSAVPKLVGLERPC